MIREAIKVGKLLLETGLIDGASGNMSFVAKEVKGKKIVLITRTGAELFKLRPKDFVSLNDASASRDREVHRAVYEKTNFRCVLHCHGTYNVILSFSMDEVDPIDLEGKIYFKSIKVVDAEFGSKEYVEEISENLAKKGIVFAKGHGIYVAANSFIEAFNLASYAEHSCKILYLFNLFNKL